MSVAVLAGATAVAFQLSTGTAAADEAATLPITSAGDLVVDGAHQRILISDPAAGKLITTDYAGKVQSTLTDLPGVGDLMMDGDRLYAAVPGLRAIATFYPTATVPTRDAVYTITGAEPRTLARTGPKIVFGEDNAGLGLLDISGEQPATAGSRTGMTWTVAPTLATTPSRPGVVAAVETTVSPSTLRLLDVTTSPPTELKSRTFTDRLQGVAFTPDGSRILVTGIQNLVAELSPTDLSTVATYQAADVMPGDFALRADGAFAIGAGPDAEDAVALYTPGSAAAVKQLDLRSPLDEDGKPIPLDLTRIASGTLAWEPGGTRLFGVAIKGTTSATKSPIYSLQVLDDPGRTAVTVQLTAPATAGLNQPYTVLGSFDPVPVRLPMTITRTDSSGSRRVGPETVPAGGSFQFQDQQAVAGTVSYAVSFAGNGEFGAATTTRSVAVSPPGPTTLALDRNGSLYNYGTTVTFTARLGATQSNRAVEIWADPYGNDQPNRLLRRAYVDGKGSLTASIKLTRNTTVSAVFRGDTGTVAKTVKSTVSARTTVATTLTRHYKSAKIGSTTYRYFRRTSHPYFTTTIPPYPGRKQLQQIDIWSGGKWKPFRSGYYALNPSGKSFTQLTGTHTTGVRYRVRSAYLYSRSGDPVNASTYGPYRYFTFTR